MKPFTDTLKRHSLIVGLVLMFLLTWPIELSDAGLLPFRVPFIVSLFLGWGIFVAAVLMTWLTQGGQAVGALLKRFLKGGAGAAWYLAVLLIPALGVLGLGLSAAFSGEPPDFSHVYAHNIFGPSANLVIFIIPFFLTDFISNGEEIGWRGYMLPRLQARHSALVSALIVGVVWGAWHLPRFLAHWDMVSFVIFVLDVFAKSIMLTWIYNGTNGSLLLVTLTHAAYNTAGVFLSVNAAPSVLVAILEVIAAVVIVIVAGPARLSRTQPKQVEEPYAPAGAQPADHRRADAVRQLL